MKNNKINKEQFGIEKEVTRLNYQNRHIYTYIALYLGRELVTNTMMSLYFTA